MLKRAARQVPTLAPPFVALLLLVAGCDAALVDEPVSELPELAIDPPPHPTDFAHPDACGTCHVRQYREWQGSMMRYGAISPTFNAFESTVAELTNGHFAAGGQADNFCNECHTPIGVYLDEIDDFQPGAPPMRDFLGPVASEGVSCDFCHSVTGPDHGKSQLGDGIANVSLTFGPTGIKLGPIADPVQGTFHTGGEQSEFLSSAQFCGGCHDVRPPVTDVVTDAPFLRLENLFTEWEHSPYNDPDDPTTCQDCHMSLFPWMPPKTYPVGTAVRSWDGTPAPTRRVSPHYFTGVSHALIPYPGQDDPSLDEFGMPRGQIQRREAFLKAACELSLANTPKHASRELPLAVTVTNVGAGHNVPAGFSQERQVWLEVTVADATGRIVYQSGHLTDSPHPETGEHAPDGHLHDEDLQDEFVDLDPSTFEARWEAPGPDRDQRPHRQLGLVNFQNRFLALDGDGELHTVHSAHLADTIDNSRSLPPLEPRTVRYDITVPEDATGPLHVAVRLRYRTFPPNFLRVLAQRHPDLVTEAMIDRNHIVDMAAAELVVALRNDAERDL